MTTVGRSRLGAPRARPGGFFVDQYKSPSAALPRLFTVSFLKNNLKPPKLRPVLWALALGASFFQERDLNNHLFL